MLAANGKDRKDLLNINAGIVGGLGIARFCSSQIGSLSAKKLRVLASLVMSGVVGVAMACQAKNIVEACAKHCPEALLAPKL